MGLLPGPSPKRALLKTPVNGVAAKVDVNMAVVINSEGVSYRRHLLAT